MPCDSPRKTCQCGGRFYQKNKNIHFCAKCCPAGSSSAQSQSDVNDDIIPQNDSNPKKRGRPKKNNDEVSISCEDSPSSQQETQRYTPYPLPKPLGRPKKSEKEKNREIKSLKQSISRKNEKIQNLEQTIQIMNEKSENIEEKRVITQLVDAKSGEGVTSPYTFQMAKRVMKLRTVGNVALRKIKEVGVAGITNNSFNLSQH